MKQSWKNCVKSTEILPSLSLTSRHLSPVYRHSWHRINLSIFWLTTPEWAMLEPCLSISEEAMNKQFDVNLKAPIVLAKIVANEMVRHSVRGAIVNISSQASMRPIDQHTVYCASKAGLDMATRCLAKELGEHGIRVNCVNPTVVMTEMGKTVKFVVVKK
ncbi:hypothetical protein COOONC_22344, partial [Cooperia oncophora]